MECDDQGGAVELCEVLDDDDRRWEWEVAQELGGGGRCGDEVESDLWRVFFLFPSLSLFSIESWIAVRPGMDEL